MKLKAIRLPEDLIKELERLAAKDERTFSDFVRIQLTRLVKKLKS